MKQAEQDKMPNSKKARGVGIGGKIAGGCGLLAVAVVLWWMSAQITPTIRIPTPTMPIPNAFDTFQLALSQVANPAAVDAAAYTPAGARSAHVQPVSAAVKAALVRANAPAIATLRRGLTEQYMNPPIRSFYAAMPYFSGFRRLARLLSLASDTAAARGDFTSSARTSLDAVEMGGKIPRGSVLIGGLVGIACQAIGRQRLWSVLDRLDSASAASAANRLDRIRRGKVTYAETLQEEKWLGQAGLLEVLRDPNAAFSLSGLASGQPSGTQQMPPPAVLKAMNSLYFMAHSKSQIMGSYTTYMDSQIELAKKPYRANQSAAQEPTDPLMREIAVATPQLTVKWLENDTQNGLLEISLALRAYRVKHGAYPQSLAELAPQILTSLPTDPFAGGQPFHYRREGSAYVLYSVGPDGADDGGRAIDIGPSPERSTNSRYFVVIGSKGDIVAGKNRW